MKGPAVFSNAIKVETVEDARSILESDEAKRKVGIDEEACSSPIQKL